MTPSHFHGYANPSKPNNTELSPQNGPSKIFGREGIGQAVLNAIGQFQMERGCSLHEIRKFLAVSCPDGMKMPDSALKLFMKDALYRNIISGEDGNYKLSECKKKSKSPGGSKKKKSASKGKQKAKAGAKKGKKKAKKT